MLWEATSTRQEDRKRIARCLIENVVVHMPEQGEKIRAEIQFAGGEVTTLEVVRGKPGQHRFAADPEVVELVRLLAPEFTDDPIARIFQRKGLLTSKGLTFTGRHVTNLRYNHGIDGSRARTLDGEDVYTTEEASRIFGVVPGTIVRWVEAGLLKASQLTPGASWRVRVREEDRRRLMTAEAPADWLGLKAAARALHLGQTAVLQKVSTGEIEGVRVRTGRRTGWRISVAATTYDQEPSLFDSPGI
jgi:hypothetical protein